MEPIRKVIDYECYYYVNYAKTFGRYIFKTSIETIF